MSEKPTSPPRVPDSESSGDAAPDTETGPPRNVSPGDAMRTDRESLRRVRGKRSPEGDAQRLRESAARRRARESARLRIEFPEELPITARRDDLVRMIREHPVLVVCGETGSGKSTQLPKLCLEAGLGREAMIGHTQPRRLAARSIAERLAEELDVPLGKQVGYQIRFGDRSGPETLVKLMTDGILLAETQSDRSLDAYDAIIIDEAHERSLNIDFLLGYLRQLQSRRPDLKVIITSATIDAERFAEHFAGPDGPAPIVNVEGRGYPVETRYLPWEDVVDDETRGYDLARHVIAGLDSVSRDSQGDVLVFLPTERDIREVSHRVGGHFHRLGLANRVDLLPLYARLPQSEQQRIFRPDGRKRRIIFATNVAESSLTVPGIHAVVDTGTARISRYSPRSKVQRLPIEAVSQASANQRGGRCGRIGPGICVRLYSADDFDGRDRFTTPEIRRTGLASVILKMKTLRLGSLQSFPLLDPPRPEAIREGIRTLHELRAIDAREDLTEIGRKLGRMPVDPRVGRIILEADALGVLPEVLPIAAALEIQDPRDRPPEKRQAADEAHQTFVDPRSDFLGYLRLWRFHERARDEHSRSKLTRVLRQNFLSPNRMREWADVHRQLRQLASEMFLRSGDRSGKLGGVRYAEDPTEELLDRDRSEAVHRALLAGLLSGVAMAGEKGEYTGGGGLKLFLWPGSGVFATKPKWIVAAELVETSRQYARVVAQVQPAWIEQAAEHLIKRSHGDPHWSDKSNGAFCYERQSLFGLPIVARRRVPLAAIDPATARDLLIERGLVEGELTTSARFVRFNRELAETFAKLAAKTRRRDLVIDPYRVQQFYQDRLPDDVCDRGRLEKFDRGVEKPAWANRLRDTAGLSNWLSNPPKDAAADGGSSPGSPYMRPDDLVDVSVDEIEQQAFPDELAVGGSRLPLEYHFEPGADRDGVHVRVHRAALSQLSDDRLGWLVPGLLEPKLVAMIKSLPKRIRRNLVPAADVAARIAAEIRPQFGETPFMPTVCAAMSRHAEVPVTPEDFQDEKLDDGFRFFVEVVNDHGETLAAGRQIDPLRTRVGVTEDAPEPETPDESDEDWHRDSMTDFDVDALPEEVIRRRGGVQVALYPALVDLGDAVATKLLPDRASAEIATRAGITRLFAIAERKELRSQVRWLPEADHAKIRLAGLVSAAEFESAMIGLMARLAFVEGEPPVRTRDAFRARRGERARRIPHAAQEIAGWLRSFADGHFQARREIESFSGDRFREALDDVAEQVRWLAPDRFLSRTPWQWLRHYPRYFAAIAYRLDKLRSGAASRDHEQMTTVRGLRNVWLGRLSEADRTPEVQAANEFRWMLEELRVSLFAQPLGTSIKVSPRRCEKWLQAGTTQPPRP